MEILLVSAVSWEIRSLLRDLQQRGSPVAGHGIQERIAYGRTRIIVLSLGMGAERSSRNLQQALDQRTPEAVLLAGFSGAIHAHQKTGEVAVLNRYQILGEQVHEPVPLVPGTGGTGTVAVTVPALTGPSEKKKIGECWPDAFGVDLESYHLAKICSDRLIPFICARVIFDEMDHNLPSLLHAWELPAWYLRYRRASQSLSQAVRRVLDTLENKDSLELKESIG